MSLQQLTGTTEEDPDKAPTPLVASIQGAWRKPLNRLSNEEIGQLVAQQFGFPYILDLVWPKLVADPLFDGGYYPGDVLSMLIRADQSIWAKRPDYQAGLDGLYRLALARPEEENDGFRESLSLPEGDKAVN